MKVGDYVRTKYGITQIKENVCLLDEVIKSSPNIIDLIEVGDYVNGDKVEANKYGDLYIGYVYCGGDIGRMEESYTTFLKDIPKCFDSYENYIVSIVTKEQFESMEYKIGE